jgi:hypothetical protein
MVNWVAYVRARIALPAIDSSEERQIVEELAAHLEETYSSSCRQGLLDSEAMRLAEEQVKAAAVVAVLATCVIFDRQVLPMFTTAMFGASVVNGVLLPGIALLLGDLVFRLIEGRRA